MALAMLGRPVAHAMELNIKNQIQGWRAQGMTPRMVTFLVGEDAASVVYAEQKVRVAKRLGIQNELIRLSSRTDEASLCQQIDKYSRDASVHGIMLELPLPAQMNTRRVISSISPEKDVDGLLRGLGIDHGQAMYPATPLACIRLLKHYGFSLKGKHVALIGYGRTVGMPLFQLLIQENATVTVCHAGTVDISLHTRPSDIIFVAAGCADLITEEMVRPHHVIVDAGINECAVRGIVGDVAPQVMDIVHAMTPTPGGVGSVTTLQLFDNLLTTMAQQIQTQPELELVAQ